MARLDQVRQLLVQLDDCRLAGVNASPELLSVLLRLKLEIGTHDVTIPEHKGPDAGYQAHRLDHGLGQLDDLGIASDLHLPSATLDYHCPSPIIVRTNRIDPWLL